MSLSSNFVLEASTIGYIAHILYKKIKDPQRKALERAMQNDEYFLVKLLCDLGGLFITWKICANVKTPSKILGHSLGFLAGFGANSITNKIADDCTAILQRSFSSF